MLSRFVLPALRGCGQMLFQPSARTGSVFLVLILSQSTGAFFMCLAGVLGATLCAHRLEAPGRPYAEGEGGFNGGLLGLALWAFYGVSGMLLLLGFVGGVVTALVRWVLLRLLPVPPFTAPFVVTAWPAFFLSERLLGVPAGELATSQAWHGYALLTNASQVLFLLDVGAGALVFVAVGLHSRAAAFRIAAASMLVWLIVMLFDLPPGLSASGLLGYNALILAAALQHRGTRWPLFAGGVIASIWLSVLFFEADVTPLSAPFVLAAWLVIGVEAALAHRIRRPDR